MKGFYYFIVFTIVLFIGFMVLVNCPELLKMGEHTNSLNIYDLQFKASEIPCWEKRIFLHKLS